MQQRLNQPVEPSPLAPVPQTHNVLLPLDILLLTLDEWPVVAEPVPHAAVVAVRGALE